MDQPLQFNYFIEKPLIGTDQWFTICVCKSPQVAGEVIGILAKHTDSQGNTIRLRIVPDPTTL
jgi:hypothetical protein